MDVGSVLPCARVASRRPAGAEVENQILREVSSKSVPWQTPHCIDKDGKLRMDPEAEKWLAIKSRER